jgi:hypothetical protein
LCCGEQISLAKIAKNAKKKFGSPNLGDLGDLGERFSGSESG